MTYSRTYDFQPNTKIASAEVDAELNAIITALNTLETSIGTKLSNDGDSATGNYSIDGSLSLTEDLTLPTTLSGSESSLYAIHKKYFHDWINANMPIALVNSGGGAIQNFNFNHGLKGLQLSGTSTGRQLHSSRSGNRNLLFVSGDNTDIAEIIVGQDNATGISSYVTIAGGYASRTGLRSSAGTFYLQDQGTSIVKVSNAYETYVNTFKIKDTGATTDYLTLSSTVFYLKDTISIQFGTKGEIVTGTSAENPLNVKYGGASGGPIYTRETPIASTGSFSAPGANKIGIAGTNQLAVHDGVHWHKVLMEARPLPDKTNADVSVHNQEGLIAFNYTTHKPCYHDGTSWVDLP